MMSFGLARNITPSCTTGVVTCVPGSIAHDHASWSPCTLLRVISLSGLYPHPSAVLRQWSQSASGGRRSISSVTGLMSRMTRGTSGTWADSVMKAASPLAMVVRSKRLRIMVGSFSLRHVTNITDDLRRQCEGDELSRQVVPADSHDEILLAVEYIGHRRTGRSARQFHLEDNPARRLVVGAKHLAAAVLGKQGHACPPALAEKEQRLGDERRCAPRLPERWQVEMLDGWMVARAIPVGYGPHDRTFVEVDCGQPPVWRLEYRKALRSFQLVAELVVPASAVPGLQRVRVLLHHLHDRRRMGRRNVQNPGLRIGRCTENRGADDARHDDRSLRAAGTRVRHRKRREHWSIAVPADDGDRFLPQLGCEVDEVVDRHALLIVGRRLGGEGLRLRIPFAGHITARHGTLFDRPDRPARHAIERVDEADLRYLRDRLDLPSVDGDIEKNGSCRQIVIPDVVVDRLKVPDTFAGRRVQAYEAVCEQVLSRVSAAVRIAARLLQRQIDVPELVVGAERRPCIGEPREFPRVVVPRVAAVLAPARRR